MTRSTQLLGGKNAQAVQEVARDLLGRSPGERLLTTTEYARLAGVGQGTVQKALRTLEALDAIRVAPRGHLGTYLRDRDFTALWHAAGHGTVTGVLPLPDWSEVEGIATWLHRTLTERGIPINLIHASASRRRLGELLQSRASFAVMSRFVAKRALRRHAELTALLEGSVGSYYRRDSLLLITGALTDSLQAIRRVAVDRSSPNHVEITKRAFADRDVELVDAPFRRLPEAILAGAADAAAWPRNTARLTIDATTLRVLPFPTEFNDTDWWRDVSTAVVIGRKNEPHVAAIFEHIVDSGALERTQAAIAAGDTTPIF
jgi:YhfZ C-terminal domain/Helix-turn-helix domain